jgi:hypothetical protein
MSLHFKGITQCHVADDGSLHERLGEVFTITVTVINQNKRDGWHMLDARYTRRKLWKLESI